MSHPFGDAINRGSITTTYLQRAQQHHNQYHQHHEEPRQQQQQQQQQQQLQLQRQQQQQLQKPQLQQPQPQQPQPQPQPQLQLQQLQLHPSQQRHQPLHRYPDQPSYASNPNSDYSNTHPPTGFPAIQSSSRSTFNISSAYVAIPDSALVAHTHPQHRTSLTSDTVLSHKLTRNPGLDTLAHQTDSLTRSTKGPTSGDLSNQSDMRYIRGQLDVLSAEQYDDGRFGSRRGLFKSEAQPQAAANTAANSKKRGRNDSPGEREEPVEETKRARGRPRLETGAHQDMKERRKEQIRLAQRAYRNRKETAIVELEAKVAALEAGNIEIRAKFQSLLMEFVDRHGISAQIPELGRRLQQFQALLTRRGSEGVGPRSGGALSNAEMAVANSSQSDHASDKKPADNNWLPSQAVVAPVPQRPQKFLGGIIMTYEPECQALTQVSGPPTDSTFGDYTYVKMPSTENASFVVDLSFLGDNAPAPWSVPQLDSLPMPVSGAYLEKTFGRRLHRRVTEKAAKLLAMESPPYDVMHRVFGFVRNYASLESISERIKNTLSRTANEDLDEYGQPFHHVGGSGTHFADGTKSATYLGGAPFPSSGFGMGPFNERTTAVRDELLDILQRSKFPGWQGEWFDSYDVEKFLAQKSIKLPPGGGDGFVEVPPGEFYHNPLDGSASPIKENLEVLASPKSVPNFNNSPLDVASGMSMHPVQQTMAGSPPSQQTVSTIDSMLPIPATTAPWLSEPVTSDYLAIAHTMAVEVPSLTAYNNTALGLSNSPHFVYSPHALSTEGNQTRNKRVWFSVEKFIERLGTRGTCVGRGPAFRKSDIVTAFWEAAKLELE
ncbi:hypothetical protein GGS21DRAFT_538708 [Xylaria nigripes]|nr:hypothetical protein GGS21DRAFT_538708 [Xylaria nigripes]